MPDKCIGIPEVARRLGVSKPTAYVLARRADFPAFTVGNRVVVLESSFEAWMKAQAEHKTEVLTQ